MTGYGEVILSGLYLVIAAVVVIFILHFLTTRFLYPFTGRSRQVKIVFGTLYAFILTIAGLLILKDVGIDVSVIGKLALWMVLIAGVVLFLLAPFFPRLPFLPGHLIEVNGVLGNVGEISTFHTTLRKFDGTIVFIPNALILASRIQNYSDTPNRRIELKLSVNTDSNLEETIESFKSLMRADTRVLSAPEPAAFVMNVKASGVDMLAVCWVKNEDWLKTRSDLWRQVVRTFLDDDRLAMSLPQQEVFLMDTNDPES